MAGVGLLPSGVNSPEKGSHALRTVISILNVLSSGMASNFGALINGCLYGYDVDYYIPLEL